MGCSITIRYYCYYYYYYYCNKLNAACSRFHVACALGNAQIVELLLKETDDVNDLTIQGIDTADASYLPSYHIFIVLLCCGIITVTGLHCGVVVIIMIIIMTILLVNILT